MKLAPLPKKYSTEAKLVLPKNINKTTENKSSILPLLALGSFILVMAIKK